MSETTTTWTLGKLTSFILAHGKKADGSLVDELKDVPVFIAIPSLDQPLKDMTISMIYNPDGELIRVELHK